MERSEFRPANDAEKRMWTFIQNRPKFLYEEVQKEAEVTRYQLDKFAAKLRHAGILKPVGRENSQQFFTVMDDDAARAFAARKRGQKEGALWTSMRTLRAFSPQELLLAIGDGYDDLDEPYARSYCSQLLKADYLAVLQKARPGVRPARFQLVRDTGPLPPVIRNLQVLVDQNEDRAVYAAGARI
jgi:hypothetical protein